VLELAEQIKLRHNILQTFQQFGTSASAAVGETVAMPNPNDFNRDDQPQQAVSSQVHAPETQTAGRKAAWHNMRARDYGEPEPDERSKIRFDPLRQYLNEIGRHKLLTKEEETMLAQKIEAGLEAKSRLSEPPTNYSEEQKQEDEKLVLDGQLAKTDFINSNLRLVVSIARRFGQHNLDLLDLIQEGNLGLEHAVDKFDYHKGFKFSTYGTWWIKQAISRALSNKGQNIRTPVHVGDTVYQISKAESKGWTDDEIMDALSLTPTQLTEYRVIRHDLNTMSINSPMGEDGQAELQDVIGDGNSDAGYEVVDRDVTVQGILDNLEQVLTEREKNILLYRYGFLTADEPQTLDQIGAKFKLTRERVRQIEVIARLKLMHPSAFKFIGNYFDHSRHDWKEQAACTGLNTNILFNPSVVNRGRPPKNQNTVEPDPREEICDGCSVKRQCGALALQLNADAGLWAGKILSTRKKAHQVL
jgi:RNA polymerase sigma factor (sigma-70 family)